MSKPPFKKGDKFHIAWDKLLAAQLDKKGREYQKSQRAKYGNTVFVACRVHKASGCAGYIVEYELPDNPNLWGGLGDEFAIKVKEVKHGQET